MKVFSKDSRGNKSSTSLNLKQKVHTAKLHSKSIKTLKTVPTLKQFIQLASHQSESKSTGLASSVTARNFYDTHQRIESEQLQYSHRDQQQGSRQQYNPLITSERVNAHNAIYPYPLPLDTEETSNIMLKSVEQLMGKKKLHRNANQKVNDLSRSVQFSCIGYNQVQNGVQYANPSPEPDHAKEISEGWTDHKQFPQLIAGNSVQQNKENRTGNSYKPLKQIERLQDSTFKKKIVNFNHAQVQLKVSPPVQQLSTVYKSPVRPPLVQIPLLNGTPAALTIPDFLYKPKNKEQPFGRSKLADNEHHSPLLNIPSDFPDSIGTVSPYKPQKTIISHQRTWSMKDFSLGRKIGRGRFGNVYMAEEKDTGSIFAIKMVSIQQVKDEEMIGQLVEEIKLQIYLQHPNVLKMYGFFVETGNVCMILEYANEKCLFRKLRSKLSEANAAYYSRQVLDAMKYFHSENILHRDIKPENILLCEGVAKVGDFGWAAYCPHYKRQTFCGTLDYVSPQIIKGDFYDEKTDVWSLGVLIYELATGKAPFEAKKTLDSPSQKLKQNDSPSHKLADGQNATLERILSGRIQLPDTLSPDLRKLILRILTNNPECRLSLQEIEGSVWMQRHRKELPDTYSDIWHFWLGH